MRKAIIRIFKKPFTKEDYLRILFSLLSAVCLAPIVILTAINEHFKLPVVFFISILMYALVFILGGARLERWRVNRFLGVKSQRPKKHHPLKTAIYAIVNIPVGLLSFSIIAVWVVLLIRNIIFYPFPRIGEWGHAYPDRAWGGPTWEGAIVLHVGLAVVSIFAMPWVIQAITTLQSKITCYLLTEK